MKNTLTQNLTQNLECPTCIDEHCILTSLLVQCFDWECRLLESRNQYHGDIINRCALESWAWASRLLQLVSTFLIPDHNPKIPSFTKGEYSQVTAPNNHIKPYPTNQISDDWPIEYEFHTTLMASVHLSCDIRWSPTSVKEQKDPECKMFIPVVNIPPNHNPNRFQSSEHFLLRSKMIHANK